VLRAGDSGGGRAASVEGAQGGCRHHRRVQVGAPAALSSDAQSNIRREKLHYHISHARRLHREQHERKVYMMSKRLNVSPCNTTGECSAHYQAGVPWSCCWGRAGRLNCFEIQKLSCKYIQ